METSCVPISASDCKHMPSDIACIAIFPTHVTIHDPILPCLGYTHLSFVRQISASRGPQGREGKKGKENTCIAVSDLADHLPLKLECRTFASYCMYVQSVPLQTSVAWLLLLLHDGDRKPRICTSECRSGAATKNARS